MDEVSTPPNSNATAMPNHLYKYREVNQYTKRILAEREVYFASPAKFNDPFDSRPYFTLDEGEINLVDVIKMLYPFDSPAKVAQIAREIMEDRETFEIYMQRYIQQIHDRLGVLCLAEKADDILMWSHYSASHAGICIQFDTRQFPAKYRNKLFPVVYQDQYPTTSILNPNNARDVILTKAKHWSYEQEWRALSNPNSMVQLSVRAISGVVLGCNISPENEAEVRGWMKDRRAKFNIFRAVRKKKEFGLDIIRE